MDVISNTGVSSDEGDVVVCKKNHLSRRQLSDSDDEGSSGIPLRFQQTTLKSKTNNREYSDSSSGESDTNLKKHKKKKSRIIFKQLESDDEVSETCQHLSGSENNDINSKKRNIPVPKFQTQKEQSQSKTDSGSDLSSESQVNNARSKNLMESRDSHTDDDSQIVSKRSLPVKQTSTISDDSESYNVAQSKHKRMHRKEKMLDKIRKTFDRTESPNQEDRLSIMRPLSLICDNDSSSDEGRPMVTESIDDIKHSYEKENVKNKSEYRCKNIKPEKPVRMSAKEAMENMTKIKSESCRMLREKRVSLPYHRPKQVSLKDILNRKRPEFPQNKKPMSLKMNQDQLEQYAKQLEESQKHLSELYKSDDEEDENVNENDENQDDVKVNEIVDGATNCKKDGMANATKGVANSEIMDQLFDSTQAEFEKTVNRNSNDENIYCNYEKHKSEYNDETQKTDCNLGSENDSGVNSQNVASTSKSAPSDTETESRTTSEAPYHLIETKFDNMGSNTVPQQPQFDSQLISLQDTNNTEIDCEPEISNPKAKYENLKDTEENITCDLYNKHKSEENNVLNDKSVQLENENSPSTHDELVLRLNDSETSISEGNEKSLQDENIIIGDNSVQVGQKVVEAEHKQDISDDFPEDDFEDIMVQIERDVAMEDSPMLIQEQFTANSKPQLHGTPGSLIELDDDAPHMMTGVEMLKQRYLFFSNMKTPEEVEREKEKRIKPGDQRKLLKRELVKQIREQSVAEWTKRLQEEQLLKRETLETSRDVSEEEDELEKLDKQCEDEEKMENTTAVDETKDEGDNDENEKGDEQEEGENNEEEEEKYVGVEKKKKNLQKKAKSSSLIDDEAEVSEDEDDIEAEENENEDEENEYEDSSPDDTSSDEEEIQSNKPKKGRIIKAFEDSDDETEPNSKQASIEKEQEKSDENTEEISNTKAPLPDDTPDLFESQTTDGDVDIPLAQQVVNSEEMNVSFVDEQTTEKVSSEPAPAAVRIDVAFDVPNTQVDLSEVVGLCSGVFPGASQAAGPPLPTQVIGEDILQLCSGRFDLGSTQTFQITSDHATDLEPTQTQTRDSQIKTLFAELDGDDPPVKSSIYFESAAQKSSNGDLKENNKGKLVIESSDEEGDEVLRKKKNKLKRKKKLEKRALQISDDEEEEDLEEQSDYESEPDEMEDDGERVVDYDSEENEVEVQPLHTKKTKKLASEFMEKEAELTSEDEWAGSGDEDERGLDTMEREAGDDDVFHQGKLRRELEIMHMQDLMDQDRQEVRMLQEILLEDDLEGGSRQRRFRWNNKAEGEDERGTATDELGEEGREDREAELWRQQRHKRELFLRQLAEKDKSDDDILGLGTPDFLSSCLVQKKNPAAAPDIDGNTKPGDKRPKDVPSPVKNSFIIMQQQYLALKRGSSTAPGLGVRQALQRLAASVEPPAERQGSAGGSKGSFVFATLTQPQKDDELDEPAPVQNKKKRKAEECRTPKLIKKLRVEEKPRTSLLQHLTD